MYNETVGSRIKRLRKEKKITATDFGKMIGVSRAHVYRYENDEINKMPYKVLEPIAKALNVTPAYLLGTDEEQYSNNKSFSTLISRLRQNFGNVEFSDEEIDELLKYVEFILMKRK